MISTKVIAEVVERVLKIDNKKLTDEEYARMRTLIPPFLLSQMEEYSDYNYAIGCTYASVICGVNDFLIEPWTMGQIFRINSESPAFFESVIRGGLYDFMSDVMWDDYLHITPNLDPLWQIWELKKVLYHQIPVLFALRIAREIEFPCLQVVIYQIRTETGKEWRKLHFSDRDTRPYQNQEYHLAKHDALTGGVRSKDDQPITIRNSPPRLDMLALNTLIQSGLYNPIKPKKRKRPFED